MSWLIVYFKKEVKNWNIKFSRITFKKVEKEVK